MHKLIIITGHPGTGKSTIAQKLSGAYSIPYLSKDAIKERIFDGLGTGDKEWSLKVSGVAHRIMDDTATQTLKAGGSIILESNFKADIDSERFATLAAKHRVTIIQILCYARGDILFDRWNARIADGRRHKGHVEAISLDQIKADLSEPYSPLALPGELIELDTSDWDSLELPNIS